MKGMPTNELAKIIKGYEEEVKVLFERDMTTIFELYGDDWFIVDGTLELSKENFVRKEVLREIDEESEVTENE